MAAMAEQAMDGGSGDTFLTDILQNPKKATKGKATFASATKPQMKSQRSGNRQNSSAARESRTNRKDKNTFDPEIS